MRGKLSRLGMRFLLMVGGEGIQSGFHLGFSLALAHVLAAHDFGIFALTMVFGGISLTYIRALTGMPASVWMGRSYGRSAASAYEVAFGSAAVVLSLVNAAVTAVALVVWLGVSPWAGALFVGLWSLRSHVRTAFFARYRQSVVAASDAAFGLVGILCGSTMLWLAPQNALQGALLCLAAANLAGLAVLLLLELRAVRISVGRTVRRQYTRQWRHFVWSGVSVTLSNLQAQAMPFLVSGIAGPEAYAPIAIAMLFVSPLRLVGATVVNLAQPSMSAHLSRRANSAIWRDALLLTAMMLIGCGAYGGILVVVTPLLNIDSLSAAQLPLLGALAWAIQTTSLASAMPQTILEVSRNFRTLAIANLLGAIVITAILQVTGPDWALAGNLASELTVLLLCWMAAYRGLRDVPVRVAFGLAK